MPVAIDPNDLNDFIKPGQVCTKPPKPPTLEETGVVTSEDVNALPPAAISLTDCLACSGCVTSSEAALVELQSFKELLPKLNNPEKTYTVSISPQSRASLAAAFDLSISETDYKLNTLFKHLGFEYIYGQQIGRDLCIQECISEAIERFKTGNRQVTLSSVCPGITTYITKTHPKIVPMLSEVKSPQQITGHLIKTHISKELKKEVSDVFHLAIMPCFDNKLESANAKFVLGNDETPEVDLVLTPKEIVEFLHTEWQTTFPKLENTEHHNTIELNSKVNSMASNSGSTSGGYLHYILQTLDSDDGNLQIKKVNNDYTEYELNGFKAAEISGFKNIQNLVRKLNPKSRRAKPQHYDYVELMACPSGCINGGGQIHEGREKLKEVEAKYMEIPKVEIGQVEKEFNIRTHYEPIEPDPIALGTTW